MMTRLLITMGDAAGIGPEVVVKAVSAMPRKRDRVIIVFGDAHRLRMEARRLRTPFPFTLTDRNNIGHAGWKKIWLCDLGGVPAQVRLGRVSAACGRASMHYVTEAAAACLAGEADAMVTAPIHKEAWAKTGSRFSGHTDLLAHLCKTNRELMLLVGGNLRVALATIHIPLRQVPRQITKPLLLHKLQTLHSGLRDFFGISAPRIAVCGINPHAGEAGVLGHEDAAVVAPAVRQAARLGLNAVGPLPGDTAFYRASQGEFDAVLAMYHDQGLAPIKLVAFDEAVNITLGLPIIRTSPDHGTAFDIANKTIAHPCSLINAVEVACHMARLRKNKPRAGFGSKRPKL